MEEADVGSIPIMNIIYIYINIKLMMHEYMISKTHGSRTWVPKQRISFTKGSFFAFSPHAVGICKTSIPVTLESLTKLSCVMCTCKMREV